MRSRPYTPPPSISLPPLLAAVLPLQTARDVPLDTLDPETSRLIPVRKKKRQHHVRVQGRLALVRSISIADLSFGKGAHATNAASAAPPSRYFESAVGSAVASTRRHRRRSLDEDGRRRSGSDDSDIEEDERETTLRDQQLRGYGIGGVGNIRTLGSARRPSRRCSCDRALAIVLLRPRSCDRALATVLTFAIHDRETYRRRRLSAKPAELDEALLQPYALGGWDRKKEMELEGLPREETGPEGQSGRKSVTPRRLFFLFFSSFFFSFSLFLFFFFFHHSHASLQDKDVH